MIILWSESFWLNKNSTNFDIEKGYSFVLEIVQAGMENLKNDKKSGTSDAGPAQKKRNYKYAFFLYLCVIIKLEIRRGAFLIGGRINGREKILFGVRR